MSVTNHERPGVYSRYDASTVVKGRGGGGGCVGLAALCGTGTAGTLYTFNRYEEAVTAFGGEETLTELVRLLFLNGAAQVKAVPVAEEAGYKAAFSVLEAAEDIAVVVCDSGELTVQQALRDSVKAASEARRERIAVVGGKAGENATALVQRAEGLNSERVVLTAPVGEGGGAAVAAGLWFIMTQTSYMAARLAIWQDPWSDPLNGGYQTIQSLYAIGSGGLLGLGLGKSRQKFLYLPEPENDFIFAIVCEELGLIGAGIVLILFALLVMRGYWIAIHARDRFGALLVVGITTLTAVQVFLNISVVTNLIPTTGISLPFFSYGGTALMIQLAEMGIILSVSRQIPAPRQE